MRNLKRIIALLFISLIMVALAFPAFAADGSPPGNDSPVSSMTWEFLGTMSGATAAVLLIIQFIKAPLDNLWKIPTRIWAYVFSIIILLCGELVFDTFTVSRIPLILLNAIIVTMAAVGAYAATFQKLEAFEFWDEPLLNEYRNTGGTFLIEDPSLMKNVTWTGAKLSYVKSLDPEEDAWSDDYLQIEGDFTITYNVPKIIQGKYDLYLWANRFSSANAVIEVYVDGNKLGGLIDLTSGADANWVYRDIKVGTVDFKKYAGHSIQIKTLIPGRFIWDAIQFRPV